jgi:hypothetical protein
MIDDRAVVTPIKYIVEIGWGWSACVDITYVPLMLGKTAVINRNTSIT